LSGFVFGQINLCKSDQVPGQIGHDVVLFGFVMVLYTFVLVSAGLAAFCVVLDLSRLVSAGLVAFCVVLCCFYAGLGWSRCVLCGFLVFGAGLCWSRCVLFDFVLFWAARINLCKSDPGPGQIGHDIVLCGFALFCNGFM